VIYPKMTPMRSHEKYVGLFPIDPRGLERRDGTCPCGGTLQRMGFILSTLLGLDAIRPKETKYPVMKTTERKWFGRISPNTIKNKAIIGGRLLRGVVSSSGVASVSDLAAERRMSWIALRTLSRLGIFGTSSPSLLLLSAEPCTSTALVPSSIPSSTPVLPGDSIASFTVGGSSPLANESVILILFSFVAGYISAPLRYFSPKRIVLLFDVVAVALCTLGECGWGGWNASLRCICEQHRSIRATVEEVYGAMLTPLFEWMNELIGTNAVKKEGFKVVQEQLLQFRHSFIILQTKDY